MRFWRRLRQAPEQFRIQRRAGSGRWLSARIVYQAVTYPGRWTNEA
jgi:hypothetical protein